MATTERRCPFCAGTLAEPRRTFAAGAVLAGLVLGGCVSRVETPIEGDSEGDSDSDVGDTEGRVPTPDLPNSEATYGVPGTDSDWYGTETDGASSSSTGAHSEATSLSGTDTDTDTDTEGPSTESDGDTDTDSDTDTDTEGTATGIASSDAGG